MSIFEKTPMHGNALFRVSTKGIAMIAAMDSGLCPEHDGKMNYSAFEKFWKQYQIGLFQHGLYDSDELWKMFNQQCDS